jgi:hypothetical protein
MSAIPFNNIDGSVDLLPEQLKVLNKSTLCLTGISFVMHQGRLYWSGVKNMAFSVGVVKAHGKWERSINTTTMKQL